jgi:hypothetical protein
MVTLVKMRRITSRSTWLTPAEEAEILRRDRKKLEILDREPLGNLKI